MKEFEQHHPFVKRAKEKEEKAKKSPAATTEDIPYAEVMAGAVPAKEVEAAAKAKEAAKTQPPKPEEKPEQPDEDRNEFEKS